MRLLRHIISQMGRLPYCPALGKHTDSVPIVCLWRSFTPQHRLVSILAGNPKISGIGLLSTIIIVCLLICRSLLAVLSIVLRSSTWPIQTRGS